MAVSNNWADAGLGVVSSPNEILTNNYLHSPQALLRQWEAWSGLKIARYILIKSISQAFPLLQIFDIIVHTHLHTEKWQKRKQE